MGLQDHSFFSNTYILRERACLPAVDFVARFKLPDVLAEGFDRSGEVDAESRGLRLTQPDSEAHDVRRAADEVPIVRIDGNGPDSNQELVVVRHRLGDVHNLEDIGRTVVAIDDRFHLLTLDCAEALTIVRRSPVGDK